MSIISRVPFGLLVPAVALISLAFSRASLEPPPPAEEGVLSWRQLHRHSAAARGPHGLGSLSFGIRRQDSVIYAAGPSQSLRSTDGGVKWHDLPRSLNGFDVAFGDNELVLVGGRGKFQRSTDAGETWTTITPPSDGLITGIALDGDTAVAVGIGTIIRSTDAGLTWQRVKAPDVLYTGVAKRGRTIVVVGSAGLVVRSDDQGETWHTQWLPQQHALNAVQFANDSIVVIVTSSGGVQRSTDGGRSWGAIDTPARARLRGVAFTEGGEGLAVGHWGEVIRSRDGGATWQREKSGTRLHFLDVEVDPAGGFLVCGARESVFSVAGEAR